MSPLLLFLSLFTDRNGTNGKTNGASDEEESFAASVCGFLFSLLLPIAGIAYFIVLVSTNQAAMGTAAAVGSDALGIREEVHMENVVQAVEQEL